MPPLAISGQLSPLPLFSVKLGEILGLFPEERTGKLRASLPMFTSVTVCGLSELVLPTSVSAKLSEGGLLTAISFTAVLAVFATKMLPLASTATPVGKLRPLPTVFTVELELTSPLTARISFTALLPVSATKTSPLPSTATPTG